MWAGASLESRSRSPAVLVVPRTLAVCSSGRPALSGSQGLAREAEELSEKRRLQAGGSRGRTRRFPLSAEPGTAHGHSVLSQHGRGDVGRDDPVREPRAAGAGGQRSHFKQRARMLPPRLSGGGRRGRRLLCGNQPVRRVSPSSRRRVDGVEDDAMIQHERAVKF